MKTQDLDTYLASDMEIVNWAQCDRMLIRTMIGLRYETETDQLRYVLAKMREMFHAHPKIDRDTVRVRFAGYGASTIRPLNSEPPSATFDPASGKRACNSSPESGTFTTMSTPPSA